MITGIIQQMHEGAEQIGSGSGCGTRDLDFLTEGALTYEQIEALKAKILETTDISGEEVDIIFESYDETGENLIEAIATE